jgi:hypothetical protein
MHADCASSITYVIFEIPYLSIQSFILDDFSDVEFIVKVSTIFL